MANEVTIPILPCRDLDVSIAFYEALGFVGTYRQERPNRYAVVSRGDFHVHLFTIDGFDPEQSYASVIVVVPDADELFEAFAAGLRAAYGKLPSAGIPRILRPRKMRAPSGALTSSTRAATGYASPITATLRSRPKKRRCQVWPG
jgi:catechol 2,3-dioxygenase-like lactoylglutathione lyase family enzyme